MPRRRAPKKSGKSDSNYVSTLLVDGDNLFNIGFHGAKNEYNYKGQHIGGLYQFITVLRRILTEDLYHKVYVFWDGEYSGKLRYEIYPEYKQNRNKDYDRGTVPDEEDKILEKHMIKEYLEELFVRQIEHQEVEADDLIGHYCNNKAENEKITICSGDRDICQLVSEDVRVYLNDLKSYVDKSSFVGRFGYLPENALLVKILVGDESDNIKGVTGLKEKKLLNNFPELATKQVNMDYILKRAKEIQEERENSKKKRLKVLDNVLNSVTSDGQRNDLYEVNRRLMDLKNPLLTEDSIEKMDELINNPLDPTDREIKNVYSKMKRDGIDRKITEDKSSDYLLPFKKLINREKKLFN